MAGKHVFHLIIGDQETRVAFVFIEDHLLDGRRFFIKVFLGEVVVDLAITLVLYAALLLKQGRRSRAAVMAVFGVLMGLWYLTTDEVQPEFIQATPYVITLLVLSIASQRLRPPAAEGRPWRKGQVE